MLEIMTILVALLGHVEAGTAYTFSAVGDPWNPNPHAACLHRDMDDRKDIIVAHRTLPCRSQVLIYSLETGKQVIAVVGDRGPFGKTRRGRYRGVVDVSPRVNRLLGLRGRGPVVLFPIQ